MMMLVRFLEALLLVAIVALSPIEACLELEKWKNKKSWKNDRFSFHGVQEKKLKLTKVEENNIKKETKKRKRFLTRKKKLKEKKRE